MAALRKHFMVAILLFCIAATGLCGDGFSLPFDAGDKVCFVGDSITHAGGYHHDILLYHMTRFPSVEVIFFNSGIGGDTAESILRRMDDDVLRHDPDRAMLMLGMNDVRRDLYARGVELSEKVLQGREAAISNYENNMEELVSIFRSKNVELVLQTPSIYDELTTLEAPANLGVNQALKRCRDITKGLAARNGYPVIDYWTAMNEIAVQLNQTSPHETIIGNDRVHPKEVGNFIMCHTFLKAANAPKYVSRLVIGGNTFEADNCKVESLSRNEQELTFCSKAAALPYPLTEGQKRALAYVPFNEELNVELLQVCELAEGQYTLFIDDEKIGSFSAEELGQGINLTLFENTAQYLQAVGVRKILEELWEREVQLRDIRFVESRKEFQSCPDKEDLAKLEKYFLKQFEGSNYAKYHQWVIGQYVKHKPNEVSYGSEMDELRLKAYKQAEPVVHQYRIVKSHN